MIRATHEIAYTYAAAYLREIARHGRGATAAELFRAYRGRTVTTHRGTTIDVVTFQVELHRLVSNGAARLVGGEFVWNVPEAAGAKE